MEVDTDQTIQPVESEPAKKLHFEIFYNIRLIQQQNGMKHTDFNRYRQFCSRKLRRVRKRIGFTHGKGKNYAKKTFSEENVKDAGSLFIPLLDAERAWAYAMEIKQDLSEKDNGRSHFHILNRLRKACRSAVLLKKICDATCDTDTCLEAEAYSLYFDGVYCIENDQYTQALEHFTRCSTILKQLRDICISVLQSIYSEKLKEIEPYIRYCEYNLRHLDMNDQDLLKIKIQADQYDSLLQSKIQKLLDDKYNQNRGDLSVIVWNEMKLPVEDEQIQLLLLKIRDNEIELCDIPKDQIDLLLDTYTSLFSIYDEATKMISQSIDKISKSAGSSSISNRTIQITNLLFIYIRYMKLLRITERNILLFNTYNAHYKEDTAFNNRKVTINDLLAMISNILHNIKDMNALLQPVNEGDTISPTNQKYIQTNEYLHFLYRAWRAFYASNLYASVNSYKEASFLSDATEEFLKHLYDLKMQYGEPVFYADENSRVLSIDNVDDLDAAMKTYPIELHANAILNKIPMDNTIAVNSVKYNSDANLLDKLDDVLDITSNVTLFEIPPKMTPLTTKPLFFDVLFNEMNYKSINFQQYLQANIKKTKQTQKAKSAAPSASSAPASTVEEPKSSGYGWFSKWF